MAPSIQKLGIIAGGGELPTKLLEICKARDISSYIIGIQGQAEPALCDTIMPVGKAGGIIRHLRQRDIHDLVFIGKMHRPSWGDLRLDFKTIGFFARVGFNTLGDDGLLKAMRRELEGDGFTLHGVHEFMPDLLADAGTLGQVAPSAAQRQDIDMGIEASQELGRNDLGQSVIVHHGMITGHESKAGTDALIRASQGGILVKTCKPQQDRDLDLPTIGPKTIEAAYRAKLSGIAVQAGATLIADRAETITLADQYGLFLIGVEL